MSALSLLFFLSLATAISSRGRQRKKPHLNLSEIGAATYEIPLMVPPGSGGLAPDLSLQTNSQRGDGLLGVGWPLSGLSKITRCPRNIAQDGYVSSVNYSQVAGQCDQFSLTSLRHRARSAVSPSPSLPMTFQP